MNRTLLACGLVTLLAGSTLAQVPGTMRSRTGGSREDRAGARRHHDDRHERRDERRTRPGYSRWTAPAPPDAHHATACGCGSCGGGSTVVVVDDRGGRRHGGDRTVIVVRDDRGHGHRRGGDGVVLAGADRRRPATGTDASLLLAGYDSAGGWSAGGRVALSGSRGEVVVAGGTGGRHDRGWSSFGAGGQLDPDCARPGAVVATSGDLYVRVRADGRLEIRSR